MALTPVGVFRTPRLVGNMRIGKPYYVSPALLCTDSNLRTLWLNINSKYFEDKPSLSKNFCITRIEEGTEQDFTFNTIPYFLRDSETGQEYVKYFSIKNLKNLFDIFYGGGGINDGGDDIDKLIRHLTIPKKIEILTSIKKTLINGNEQELQELSQGYPGYLIDAVDKRMNKDDINTLEYFGKYILKYVKKETMDSVLINEDYTKILGDLTSSEELKNVCISENITFKRHEEADIIRLMDECFDHIIMSPDVKKAFYRAMNLQSIISGKKAERGGAILIDYGGTGKSMLKKGIIKFAEKLNATVKEKGQGDITSYVNAGPQVIQKWYRGSKSNDEITGGNKEEDLLQNARKNRVLSFLIVDEAENLIKKESNNGGNTRNLDTINTWKKFIQEHEKGGVTGYVTTLLIANMERDEIDGPLSQGGERLEAIRIGQPNDEQTWLRLLEMYVSKSNLTFSGHNDLSILARLLLHYKNNIAFSEEFCPSQRTIEFFIKSYLSTHISNIVSNNRQGNNQNLSLSQEFIREVNMENQIKEQNSSIDIDLRTFMDEIINGLLFTNDYYDDPKHRASTVETQNKPPKMNRNNAIQSCRDLVNNYFTQNNTQQQTQQTPQQQNIQNLLNSIVDDQQLDSAKNQCFNFIRIQQQLFANNQFSESNFIRDFPVINTAFTTILQRAQQTNFSHYQTLSGIINQLNQYSQNQITIPLADLQRILIILQNLIPRIQ